jgi:hypothetical protein
MGKRREIKSRFFERKATVIRKRTSHKIIDIGSAIGSLDWHESARAARLVPYTSQTYDQRKQ